MARNTLPGPRGKWLVGDVIAYQRDRIGWLADSREKHGDLVRLAPGTVVVHDADLAHDVLAATNDAFGVDSMLRTGRRQRAANEAHLEQWMRVRRGVWRAIAERITRLHVQRFTTELAADLRWHSGRPVDVVETGRSMLGRAIADFCVGGDPDGNPAGNPDGDPVGSPVRDPDGDPRRDPDGDPGRDPDGDPGRDPDGYPGRAALGALCGAADELFVAALHALVSGEGRVGWWPRPAARRAVAANQRLLDMLAAMVRRRGAGTVPEQPRDLLDGLVAGAGSEAGVQHCVLVLRTIMFASHGVPGAAFSWIALRLAEHPGLASRIAAETAEAIPLDPAELAAAVPYTSAFVKETLRLHPPQWLLTRSTRRPLELAGHTLPANTEVLLCPYLIHRDPRWWDGAQRFDPGRWLGREQPHARHAYLPFGAGPRVCPGSLLATVQLTVLTALLARDYRLDLPPLASVPASTDGLLLPTGLTGAWHARRSGTGT